MTDRLGRKNFFVLSTLLHVLAMALMVVWIEQLNFGMWLVSFLAIGSLYGGSA